MSNKELPADFNTQSVTFDIKMPSADFKVNSESLLSEKRGKAHVKVEYVRVTDSIFNLKPDLDAGELYCGTCDGYSVIDKELTLMGNLYEMNVYRKVEVTWQDEVNKFISDNMHDSDALYIKEELGEFIIDGKIPIKLFIEMCHLVVSLTK